MRTLAVVLFFAVSAQATEVVYRIERGKALAAQAGEAAKAGRLVEVAELLTQAVRQGAWPRDRAHYAAAVAWARAGDREAAFTQLELAVRTGFQQLDWLNRDEALAALRTDRRWRRLHRIVAKRDAASRMQRARPSNARLVFDDLTTYCRAAGLALKQTTREGKARMFADEYLARGTDALRDFYAARKIEDADRLARALEESPAYYGWIARELPSRIRAIEPQVNAALQRLEELYPAAVFPDIYFLVGHNRSMGTVSDRGLLMGAEAFAVTDDTPMHEIPPERRQFHHPLANLPYSVAHELIHYQQSLGGMDTLLERALVEGGADFLAGLLVPGSPLPVERAWADAHAQLVRERFIAQMHGTDTSEWIANNNKATAEWPAALGYYVGYRIAEGYYERARNKKKAVRDLIELRNPGRILAASGYLE